MSALLDHLSGPAGQNVALTLLHTLWQGALAAWLLYLALRRISVRRQHLRYALSLAALGGILLGGLVTWSVLSLEPPRDQAAAPPAAAAISARPDRSVTAPVAAPQPAVPAVARSGRHPVADTLVAARSPEAGRSVWSSLLVICWAGGVAIMLVRMIASVAGAQRLAQSPQVTDPLILSAVDELRARLRIARRVRVVASSVLSSPAVLGVFSPTLLLPASLMTGLTPDQWRALLAHELAHIRRYDYLVNLAAMLIEAVLFFNPAVWWISRRVRAEREACCDALAVAATGAPLSYAEALADWAERSRTAALPHAAVALMRDTERGTLLDRIQRLLVPGYQPQIRLSWAGLAALLLSGVIVLAGLWRGTTAVVALAAEVLSPAERIEKLEQVQQEYGPPSFGDAFEGQVTVSGRLRTFDGEPLPEKVQAHAHSDRAGYSHSATLNEPGATFSYELPAGIIYLRFEAEGYAPLITEPLRPDKEGRIDGLDLVFQPGFRGEVRVVDAENGAPVAGAVLRGNVPVQGSYASREWKTDRDGVAIIEHAAERPYVFEIRASGFQLEHHEDVRLNAEEPVTLELRRAQPTAGVVIGPDGEPIAGATIRLLFEHRSGRNHGYGERGPLLATTSDSGEFTLDVLSDESIYALWIDAERYGPKVVQNVEAGMTDLRIEVAPELTLTGEISGDLSKLHTVRGKPYVNANQRYQIRDGNSGHEGMTSQRADVVISDDVGRFEFRNLLPGEITLRVGGTTVRTGIREPGEKIEIDLDEPPVGESRLGAAEEQSAERTVTLRFVPPGDGPPPTGTVFVSGSGRAARHELVDGRVTLKVEAPGSIYYRAEDLVGYWFKEESVGIEAGEGPAEIEIPLVPAGAIYGQVLNPDGTPVSEGISISGIPVSKPPELENESLNRHNVRVDVEGRFFATPLPLGGTWQVKATQGKNVQFSEVVEVSETEPAPRVTVRLVEPVAIEGTVLNAEGRPVPRMPVALRLEYSPGANTWSPELTDRHGQFRFEVNPAAGEYHVELKPRQDYVPTTQSLRTDGEPNVIRIERGAVLHGTVLDAAGSPVPGVEVYAMPADRRESDLIWWDAEAPTDDEGRFRFSTLAEGRAYDIRARGFRAQNAREHEGIVAGERESIVIRSAR